MQKWLSEGHLARYVVDVVEGLDLSELERAYAGRGSDAYHPAMLLSLLIYGYATGTFSSRKIERATYDSLAFRYIACTPRTPTMTPWPPSVGALGSNSNRPSCRCCRWRGRTSSRASARSVWMVPRSTPTPADIARLAYGHAEKIEARLKAEVQELFKLAEAADQTTLPDGMKLADEIKRREDRLAAIAEAKAKIEARAQERFEREQAEYQAKIAAREAKAAATGKKPKGSASSPFGTTGRSSKSTRARLSRG